jgi:hypothetical protein
MEDRTARRELTRNRRDPRSRATSVKSRVAELEALCADLYQVLGAVGAPEPVLDAVSAAAAGKPLPPADLLPIDALNFNEVKERQDTIDEMTTLLAKHLAARGGRQSTEAKRQAARANGGKGGRPRKQAVSQ